MVVTNSNFSILQVWHVEETLLGKERSTFSPLFKFLLVVSNRNQLWLALAKKKKKNIKSKNKEALVEGY